MLEPFDEAPPSQVAQFLLKFDNVPCQLPVLRLMRLHFGITALRHQALFRHEMEAGLVDQLVNDPVNDLNGLTAFYRTA